MPTCIYCTSQGPFGRREEHTLPRGFGEFKDAPILKGRVCTKCNNEIGQFEEQLCRSGVEGFFREYLGIEGRSSHQRVNPFLRGSSGAAPIDFIAEHSQIGCPVLWELNRGERTVREVRQVILIPEHGESQALRIPDWMKTSEELRKEIEKLNLGKLKEVRYFAAEEELSLIKSIVQSLGSDILELPTEERLVVTNPIIKVSVTSSYFRAIAKVGFHHFLALCPEITGSEMEFDGIRTFIKGSGDVDNFVVEESEPLIAYPTPNHRPDKWCHMVHVRWNQGKVEALTQFFIGPDYEPSVFRVRLGEKLSVFESPDMRGTAFVYMSDFQEEGYSGIATPLLKMSSNNIPEGTITIPDSSARS